MKTDSSNGPDIGVGRGPDQSAAGGSTGGAANTSAESGSIKPSGPGVPDSVQGPARELYELVNNSRGRLRGEAAEVKRLGAAAQVMATFGGTGNAPQHHDRGETIANLMLAYRHLEDASMRLGKALQAIDGGVSVYDRNTTVGA